MLMTLWLWMRMATEQSTKTGLENDLKGLEFLFKTQALLISIWPCSMPHLQKCTASRIAPKSRAIQFLLHHCPPCLRLITQPQRTVSSLAHYPHETGRRVNDIIRREASGSFINSSFPQEATSHVCNTVFAPWI